MMWNDKILKIIVVILASFFNTEAFTQTNDPTTNEEIKTLLFVSVETDGGYIFEGDKEHWDDFMDNHYKFFSFQYSEIDTFLKPNQNDSVMGAYTLQLYKIPEVNSKTPSRFLLRYKDFYNTTWLRIGGYTLNDLNLLFDYLLEHRKIKKKHLWAMFKMWENTNPLYKEVDLPCKFKGYLRNNTENSCYYSVHYISTNSLYVGTKPLTSKQMSSSFSRIPLGGFFKLVD